MQELPAADVLAILVVHDGAEWLPACLDALAAQTYPHRLIVVDNGSRDDSRDILLSRMDPDDLLVAERDLGFGAAVAMALDAAGERPDWILLVHDDLVLEPNAIEALVTHAVADPRLAVVGTKLVDYDEPTRLAEVGMSVDITGRPDSGLEADELDQGQRDSAHEVLYVSTAGMFVRADAFDQLGRFDRRYHVFRDDLDLCWRAWLAGHTVEIAPRASGRHAAGASNYRRLGQTAFLGPRYFAERNTLATLIKNYSGRRLLYLVPLFFVVGVAKVVGFIATRRVSDAWQTVRAWVWNAIHLPNTVARRRATQALRVRSDAELGHLFAKTSSRLRAYFEAIGSWLAGGDDLPDLADEEVGGEPPTASARVLRLVRAQPILVGGIVLGVLALVAFFPLLRPGQLRGGELAPFPASAFDFFRAYLRPWNDAGGGGTPMPPSPAQALLGFVSFLSFGSRWLAQRVLLLAPLPLAWLLAVVALRVVTPRRAPRLAGATVYVLSPPALAALATGRISSLGIVVALPALVITLGVVVRHGVPATVAWRGTAAAALVGSAAIAFSPPFAVLLGLLLVLGLIGSAVAPGTLDDRRMASARLGVIAISVVLLLFPWSFTLVGGATPILGGFEPSEPVVAAAWRWLLLSPDAPAWPGIAAGVALMAAGVLGVALGLAKRPVAVPMLWGVALVTITVAWLTGRAAAPWTWPGDLLLVAAAALSGLLAVGLDGAEEQLGRHAFGWRQLAALLTAVVVTIGVATNILFLLRGPWDAFVIDEPALPAFLAAERGSVGEFRVLVLAGDATSVRWDVTGPDGVSMLEHGVPRSATLLDLLGAHVADVLAGTDVGAAAQFGLANVRYVVVPEGGRTAALERALASQVHLEPQPVAAGLLYEVQGWLPRAAWLSLPDASYAQQRGEVPPAAVLEPLERQDPSRYEGHSEGEGVLMLAEPAASGWRAEVDGREVPGFSEAGVARFPVATEGAVLIEYSRGTVRLVLVSLQALIALVVLSLMLRPPRFALPGQEVRR